MHRRKGDEDNVCGIQREGMMIRKGRGSEVRNEVEQVLYGIQRGSTTSSMGIDGVRKFLRASIVVERLRNWHGRCIRAVMTKIPLKCTMGHKTS